MSIYDFITIGDSSDSEPLFLDQKARGIILNTLLTNDQLIIRAVTITFDPHKYYKPHRLTYKGLDNFTRTSLRNKFHRYNEFTYKFFSELTPKNLHYHLHGYVCGHPLKVGNFIKYCIQEFGFQCEVTEMKDFKGWLDYCQSKGEYFDKKHNYITGFRPIEFLQGTASHTKKKRGC